MRRLRRVPWVALVLWAALVLGAVEAAGVAASWWVLTRLGQVVACSGVVVLALALLALRAAIAEAAGQHTRAALARVKAEALAADEADIHPDLRGRYYADGEVEEPSPYLDGPSFGHERRAYPGRTRPGGRRRTDPPLRRRPRGGPDGPA